MDKHKKSLCLSHSNPEVEIQNLSPGPNAAADSQSCAALFVHVKRSQVFILKIFTYEGLWGFVFQQSCWALGKHGSPMMPWSALVSNHAAYIPKHITDIQTQTLIICALKWNALSTNKDRKIYLIKGGWGDGEEEKCFLQSVVIS